MLPSQLDSNLASGLSIGESMCGFAGFAAGNWSDPLEPSSLATKMGRRISHRGPDHSAVWVDGECRVALAHARLAILDLSPAGNQPMHSPSGRYVMVYNGEIYNHEEVRAKLENLGRAPRWRGHSDTETLLAAIEAWGLKKTLQCSIGMFALALWDRSDRALYLARDRLGEKPLYYGWQGRGSAAAFLFGSELKALAIHPAFRGEIDRDALAVYMRHAYIPAPHSIYRGITKLEPGTIVRLSAESDKLTKDTYWSTLETAGAAVANKLIASDEEAVDQLEQLLLSAVGQQMVADVPLGAFLSGGVDSSTIVALMQAQSSRPIKSFSIGFHEEEYDEAQHARAVARHLGTEHTELYVSPAQAMSVIPRLPQIYDEPFADPSQIPTFLVAQLARHHVKVSLSGDAGDELFGGYNRYAFCQTMWRRISRIPGPLRAVAARGLTAISPATWNRIARAADPILPAAAKVRLPGDKIHKGASVLSSHSAANLYRGLVSLWSDPQSMIIEGREPNTLLTGHAAQMPGFSDVERMMALDAITYLPDDILVKVDRAAMAVSLETRVPLLDHRVVEFAWRLPLDLKLRNGQTKWILRQVLHRHVPRELIDRPKMGFGIPIGDWLRGPMKGWAEALLDPARLRREGFFRPEPIERMWQAHLGGSVNEQYRLWAILMFQAWLEAACAGCLLADPPADVLALA